MVSSKTSIPFCLLYPLVCLLPQRLRIARLSCQQAGEGIVRGCALCIGVASGGFRAGEHPLAGDEEVGVVRVITLGWVHAGSLLLTGLAWLW